MVFFMFCYKSTIASKELDFIIGIKWTIFNMQIYRKTPIHILKIENVTPGKFPDLSIQGLAVEVVSVSPYRGSKPASLF